MHGGAGPWRALPDRLAEALEACTVAAEAAQSLLQAGGSALDAVEAALRVLEDCPALDAGRGSYPNRDGAIQMDALIMDGAGLDLGAVAAVGGLRHPVSLARAVMEQSPHCLLVGPGAEAFADSIGFPRCPEADLRVPLPPFGDPAPPSTAAGRDAAPPEAPGRGAIPSGPSAPGGALGDTVGAVALDRYGNLAAATSTGGTRDKLPGRVGDSPLAGAGGYADNRSAAVSSTGLGEALMKLVLAKSVADFCAGGLPAQAACDAGIALLSTRLAAPGGLIAIDAAGRPGMACNTEAMPVAWAQGAGPVHRRSFLDEGEAPSPLSSPQPMQPADPSGQSIPRHSTDHP